ncbi:amidase [Rhizobium sp. 2MFCol3.1]|uniref:amidase n=1 Tax=Rhizobium sp. 2MFCol3.1 TaxID=1246459 RepID=UPI0003656D35|nr:amidase [Rhizobium sp. 2MFCol3.1]
MTVVPPTLDDILTTAERLRLQLTRQEAEFYHAEMTPNVAAYALIDSIEDDPAISPYSRGDGYRPDGEENRFGAWARKTRVDGAANGPLAGRTVVLKDNIALAGVPMVNGTPVLDGYIPEEDATVVARILDAGGIILGKATCESYCMSGGSHTSFPGPVHNPWRPGYSAGGSSSGCGALVAAGEADMAVGGDQGGSIRIPSSYCGIYGLKPTWGLVPYSGIMPIEATIDHAGPMTATVADNALLLDVIAGDDGLDPRQRNVRRGDYIGALNAGVHGLRIALVTEGFQTDEMSGEVARSVRAAAERLRGLGAVVDEISIAEHAIAPAVWTPIATEGTTRQMMLGNGMGFNWKGRYDVSLLDHHATWREHTDGLSEPLRLSMLWGYWASETYNGRYYAKAQNLVRKIKRAYDAAFEHYHLLLMPTLPRTASPLPKAGAPLSEIVKRAAELNVNTCPFDITGHPAMSVPCGLADGLPVGMMLIAKSFDEATIYRAAAEFERSGDWRSF